MNTSAAKLIANRANATLSTGPRTAAGKARVSLNRLVHGLRAQQDALLPDEDPGAFEAAHDRLCDELQPQSVEFMAAKDPARAEHVRDLLGAAHPGCPHRPRRTPARQPHHGGR
jgi:hypothetical protein